MRGRIRRRLALAIVLTALIPVCAAIWLSSSMLQQSSARFFLPEIGQRLGQSLELYQELAGAVKGRMRSNTEAIAAGPALRDAVAQRDPPAIQAALATELRRYPDLVSLTVRDEIDLQLGQTDRGAPLDPEVELQLHVSHPLPDGATLEAVFATARARFEQLEDMSRFVDTYARVAQRRETDEQTYIYAFAALLGITIIAAVGVGSSLARGVSKRLARLCDATEQVGAGDLRLRVEVSGNDEISDLARAFNLHGVFLLVVLLPLLPHIHPRMATVYDGPTLKQRLQPPGFLGLNYGRRTPLTTLLGQAVYGLLLGIFYGQVI